MAVIVAATKVETAKVFTVNVAVVAPAVIVTVVGTDALELFDDRLIVVPPAPAGPFSVTAPVEVVPPRTEDGASTRLVNAAGVIVNVPLTDVAPSVPDIVAGVDAETAEVVILKFAEVAPAGTITLGGGTALVLFDAKFTTSPPVGAGPLSVTVPVEDVPPTTEAGATVRLTGMLTVPIA